MNERDVKRGQGALERPRRRNHPTSNGLADIVRDVIHLLHPTARGLLTARLRVLRSDLRTAQREKHGLEDRGAIPCLRYAQLTHLIDDLERQITAVREERDALPRG